MANESIAPTAPSPTGADQAWPGYDPQLGQAAVRRAIVVVFGATGDLARRKILPALGRIAAASSEIDVVGVGRRPMTDAAFQQTHIADVDGLANAPAQVHYVGGSYQDHDTFAELADLITRLDPAGERALLFILAVPPSAFGPISQGTSSAGLAARGAGGARVLIEKPLGHSRASSAELERVLSTSFAPEQVLRIDHYLGKDALWNLLSLRLGTTILEPSWNRDFIDHVQITLAETAGIEHRTEYYDTAGAVRDVLQNHALQMLALTLMDLPEALTAAQVHHQVTELLTTVRLAPNRPDAATMVRGCYTPSPVETYAAIRLEVDHPRWAGVPCFLRTGKKLSQRRAEVVVQFRPAVGTSLLPPTARHREPNRLVIGLEPLEQIRLGFAASQPGRAFATQSQAMVFDRGDAAPSDPYLRLFTDAAVGDHTLFADAAAIDQSWRIVDPVIEAFAMNRVPMHTYDSGSWGPAAADDLLSGPHRSWYAS
ncbi:MAG: glucose-6-phosphate dehydrogenase [Beutenbergiaceae bacterium]